MINFRWMMPFVPIVGDKLANKFSDLSDLAIAVRHLYGAMHGDLVAWSILPPWSTFAADWRRR